MSTQRGIIASYESSAARPIAIKSTIPLALVLTASATLAAGMLSFDSIEAALEHETIKTQTEGNILKYLNYANNKYRLILPVIISVAHADADAATEKANVINAVYGLSSAMSEFGFEFRPDIVGVADWSADHDVQVALAATLDQFKGRAFVNLDASDNATALTARNTLGSRRITPVFTSLMDFNPATAATEEYCPSVLLALHRASLDGTPNKPGYSLSVSNRVLPVAQAKQKRQFLPGMQDETDPLTEAQITSFINYKGLRVWNYETCDADMMWQDARRVRIFDMAVFAVIDGIFSTVAKDLGALDSAKKSLNALMRSMVGDDVILAFSVQLDLERTTPEAITANKFYFRIEAQETPSPVLISVTFDRVDAYASVVYERLGA